MHMLDIPLSESRSKRWSEMFVTNLENDDSLWSDYLDQAKSFDERLVDGLNKIVDVILVYVGIIYYLHDISCCLSLNRA